ncbi:hypothetical protein FKM82_013250 [Ascaphus truei]
MVVLNIFSSCLKRTANEDLGVYFVPLSFTFCLASSALLHFLSPYLVGSGNETEQEQLDDIIRGVKRRTSNSYLQKKFFFKYLEMTLFC